MKIALASLSRIGARRYNQDRVAHWSSGEALLLAVADGMGGHANGELAAQLAVEFLGGAFRREATPRVADPDLFLFRSFGRAHATIVEQARRLGLPESPRTVLVACLVQDGHAYWAHAGDARLYLVRRGRVVARTRDHTRVQQLIDAGRLRETAAAAHPERNVVLECLGGARAPRLEPARVARLARDDVLLLCSDGFWAPLAERQLAEALGAQPLEPALAGLAALAESRAGAQCDNVSALAVAWGEDEIAAAASPHTVPYHELPTDVQDFTATDPDFLRMSDADIDRAVDEIRATLRKRPE